MTHIDLTALTPIDLMEEPQLASLAVLDAGIRTAQNALLAVYPELCDLDQAPVGRHTHIYLADALYYQMTGLTTLIDQYRRSLEAAHRRTTPPFHDDDIPF